MRAEVSRNMAVACLCLMLTGTLPNLATGQAVQSLPARPSQPPAAPQASSSAHPLEGVLKWARQEVEALEKNVTDYSATVTSRERIGGTLGDYETVFVKIRHRPLSIYAYVMSPESSQGNEAIYVQGKNDSRLLVHSTGITGRLFGTLSLDPASTMAMQGRRHPITQLGILHLCRELIRSVESDMHYPESQVRVLSGAKINGRPCTCMEVTHPVRRPHFQFHIARIFVDEQLKLPIRYEQYDWPKEAGVAPELVEEYTYLNLKLNNGFSDADFDPHNPNYAFR